MTQVTTIVTGFDRVQAALRKVLCDRDLQVRSNQCLVGDLGCTPLAIKDIVHEIRDQKGGVLIYTRPQLESLLSDPHRLESLTVQDLINRVDRRI